MFYLNQFLKSLVRSKFLGFLYLFSTVLLLAVALNQNKIKKVVGKFYQTDTRPYFSALLSKKVSMNSVARKIQKLPGVDRVQIIKKLNPEKELGALYNELDGELLNSLKNLTYSSFKIILSNNIRPRNEKLVKEYLGRIVGKGSLTVTNVKRPSSKVSKGSTKAMIISYANYYILGISAIFWIACFALFVKKNSSYHFLLEKFQRKSSIQTKVLGVGVTLVASLTIAFSILFQSYPTLYPALAVCLLMGLSVLVNNQLQKGYSYS